MQGFRLAARTEGVRLTGAFILHGALAIGFSAILAGAAMARDTAPTLRCPGQAISGRLESVDPGGELRLAGGLLLRMADIRLAVGKPGEDGRAVLGSLIGQELRGRGSPPDRWGRIAITALTSPDGIEPAELLVAEGLAIVDPGEADALCDPRLLAAEALARERHLGTWRDRGHEGAEVHGLVDGNDARAIGTRVGHFAVIEGRVLSVGERPSRVYINMGRASSGALTITLSWRRWAEWQRGHLSAEALRGKRVRARGTIEQWRSPMLEVSATEILELIDDATSGPSNPK